MSTPARYHPAIAVLAVVLIACEPPAGPLLPLEAGDVWTFHQQPGGAALTFTVQTTTPIAGAPHRQVQVTLTEGDRLLDAGHLYIQQTEEGLFWRLTDSAHTLFPPGLLRYPPPWRGAYTHADADVRVEETTAALDGNARQALRYTVASEGQEPLRVDIVPGVALVAIERGPFRFTLHRHDPAERQE